MNQLKGGWPCVGKRRCGWAPASKLVRMGSYDMMAAMPDATNEYDVLILGAGPAGLSTALHLAQRSPQLVPRLLVLEKAHHPRAKLCAGGLINDAEMILSRLGLDVSEIGHVDAAAAHFDFGGKGITLRWPHGHIIRVIRRDEFDSWLAGKARTRGIEIREGVTVTGVSPGDHAVVVNTTAGPIRAKVVVGADGSNGITRRSILPNAPIHTARALEVLTPLEGRIDGSVPVPGATVQESREEPGALVRAAQPHKPDHAYFDFFPVPSGIAGYVWDFPTQVEGRAMRSWGVGDMNMLAQMQRPPLKAILAEEMARHGFDLGDYELQGHPIRWFSPFNKFSAPRVILVGDAAGAEALFGEGISVALGFGMLAAAAIASAFARNDFSFGDYRRRILASPLGRSLTLRWIIAQVTYRMHWPWAQKVLWRSVLPITAMAGARSGSSWGRHMR